MCVDPTDGILKVEDLRSLEAVDGLVRETNRYCPFCGDESHDPGAPIV
jgi:hypothetical protein